MAGNFNVPFSAASNLPELNQIKIVDVDDMLDFYEPDLYLNINDDGGHVFPNRFLSLKSGKGLSRLWFLPGLGIYKEEMVENVHGVSWKTTIGIKLSGDSEVVRRIIEKMKGRRFLLFAMDNNSKIRMVGTVAMPAKFVVEFSVNQFKGRNLTFVCESRNQPYFLNTWDEKELFGPDFTDEFSDDFLSDEGSSGFMRPSFQL
jgi:hypothetical protein